MLIFHNYLPQNQHLFLLKMRKRLMQVVKILLKAQQQVQIKNKKSDNLGLSLF